MSVDASSVVSRVHGSIDAGAALPVPPASVGLADGAAVGTGVGVAVSADGWRATGATGSAAPGGGVGALVAVPPDEQALSMIVTTSSDRRAYLGIIDRPPSTGLAGGRRPPRSAPSGSPLVR